MKNPGGMQPFPAGVKTLSALPFLTSVAPSHWAHTLAQRPSIVSLAAFCWWQPAASQRPLLSHLSDDVFVKYHRIKDIFYSCHLIDAQNKKKDISAVIALGRDVPVTLLEALKLHELLANVQTSDIKYMLAIIVMKSLMREEDMIRNVSHLQSVSKVSKVNLMSEWVLRRMELVRSDSGSSQQKCVQV